MIDYLGWIATAVVVASYFCAGATAIRAVQMIGAVIWAIYGALIGASPVIVANVLVFAAAAWTAIRTFRSVRPVVERDALTSRS